MQRKDDEILNLFEKAGMMDAYEELLTMNSKVLLYAFKIWEEKEAPKLSARNKLGADLGSVLLAKAYFDVNRKEE